MGADKMATEKKGGGFFNLLDWNRKSRKKLFATGNGSPDGKKQVRRSDENLPSTRFHLPNEEDDGNDIVMTSMKENSDYSCASSVTDGEGNGNRAPGVVARLMGLDSLPTNGISEPCSTPSFESRFTRENQNQYRKRGPEFEARDQLPDARNRPEVYTGKLPDWKFQKMPSSPIERFQREILPPRSAKSLPITHYKLLSPIKNPKFVISSKEAAHIMEAAAKILEPGFQANYRGKVPHIDSSSLPLAFRDSKEYVATPQRIAKRLDLSGGPTELHAAKCLQGKSLNRSWNGSEGSSTSCRSSPGREQSNCIGGKSKGKSVSLAIQAKVNVQKREGRSYSSTQKEQDGEISWGQPFKDQTSLRSQKKVLPPNMPTILKQNNQKQNYLASKDKLPAKRSLPTHHGKKVFSGAPSSAEKTRSLNKLQGISKGGCSTEGSQTIGIGKEPSSSRVDNIPRKKRLIDGDQQQERRVYNNDSVLAGRNEKRAQAYAIVDEKMKMVEDTRTGRGDMESFAFTSPPVKLTFGSRFSLKMERNDASDDCHPDNKGMNIQANIIIDENVKQVDDNRICETDVASFTFTSPLQKPAFGSGHSTRVGKNVAVVDDCSNAYGKEWSGSGAKNKKCPSLGLNMMGEDALSILLEQKLRGLAFESESCGSTPFRFSSLDAPSTSINSPCSEYNPSENVEPKYWQSEETKLPGIPNSRVPSLDGQVFKKKHELQLAENFMECSSSSSTCEEPDHYASPFSVLEANFSNESCNSCESYDSSYGVRMCPSALAQNVGSDPTLGVTQMEYEPDLSDSASSSLKVAMDGDGVKKMRQRILTKKHERELDYVKEILFTANVNPRNFIIGRTSEKLDRLLFNLLEGKKSASGVDGGKSRRKMLFDCVRECLDLTQGCYFRAGYQPWARGMSIVKRENLPEDIYTGISAWEAMGDWRVDELVDKDMSSQLGKKDNFENDAFEAGLEIEKKILATLIDEVVAELC